MMIFSRRNACLTEFSVDPYQHDLGTWGDWVQCPNQLFAVAIKVRVQVLKVPSQPVLRVGHETLADRRESGNEQAGLADLVLVCEDKTEMRSQSEVVSKNRAGYLYQSNEVDCSKITEFGNFIRGVRMKYDKEKSPRHDVTMMHNIAVACTNDFEAGTAQAYAIRNIPLFPGCECVY